MAGSMSSLTHSQALDQLQQEINRTLENIGGLFKPQNANNRSAIAARASQLKRKLPKSIASFHEALDSIGEDLSLAKAVIRRDLAVCREKSAQEVSTQEPAAKRMKLESEKPLETTEIQAKPSEIDVEPAVAETDTPVQKPDEQAALPEVAEESATKTSPSDVDGVDSKLASSEATLSPNKATQPVDANGSTSDPALKVDTSATQPPVSEVNSEDLPDADEKAPDTAVVNEGQDLESLFNESVSGSATHAGTTTNPGTGPATGNGTGEDGTDFTAGFDFGTFTAGLGSNDSAHNSMTLDADDSITALLPGLQDYANTQPLGMENLPETDFDALFATNAPIAQGGDGGQGQRDTTFDGLDTTFDEFAEFTGNGDFTGGGGEGATNGEGDFDFNFD